MKASVIDLGFNSLKLVTYGVRDDRSFYVIEQRSVGARLGEGLDKSGYLKGEPINRTIEGLEMFREVTDSESIKHVIPVATSAVREAKNKEDFLREVRNKTGFEFRVLSDKEEAYYSFAGAFRSISQPNVLFFDLGGGSLEMVHCTNFSIRNTFSLPLGALRLTQNYANKGGTFSKKNYSKLKRRILSVLPSRDYLSLRRKTALIGVGGTVRALARFDQERVDYPLDKVHRYALPKESLEYIVETLVENKVKEISDMECIGEERARTITAGATVVESMMGKYDIDELIVSSQGLRDGILAAYLESPRAFHSGKMNGISLIKRRESRALIYSEPLISFLQAKNEISGKQAEILSSAAERYLYGLPPYRENAMFHILMDEDANIDHQSQLIRALCIIRLLRPKSSDWLYEKFRSMSGSYTKNSIKKLTALLRLLILVERTHCKLRLRALNGKPSVEILTESKRPQNLPAELFKLAILDVNDMFAIDVKLPENEKSFEQIIRAR